MGIPNHIGYFLNYIFDKLWVTISQIMKLININVYWFGNQIYTCFKVKYLVHNADSRCSTTLSQKLETVIDCEGYYINKHEVTSALKYLTSDAEGDSGPSATPMLPAIGGIARIGHSKEEYHLIRLAAILHITIRGLSQALQPIPVKIPLDIPLKTKKFAHCLYTTLSGQKSILLEVIIKLCVKICYGYELNQKLYFGNLASSHNVHAIFSNIELLT
jgi:hypothetical protein